MVTENTRSKGLVRILLYIILGILALLLPPILSLLNLTFISATYDKSYQPFELFGFTASIIIFIIAFFELKKRRREPLENIIPIILPVLVSFFYLYIISEYTIKSWDYGVYEKAAKAIISGENPYIGTIYVYPPLIAQIFSIMFRFIAQIGNLFGFNLSQEIIWNIIFYLFQCSQFVLVILTYLLCYRFAKNVGIKDLPASIIVSTLFLLNNPLIRTFRHNQVNLWILDIILIAVMLPKRYQLIGGLLSGFGGHIKPYPLSMVVPWGITKRWIAIISTVVGFVGIVFIQTNWGHNWSLWSQYIEYSRSFLKDPSFTVSYFRANTIYSIISNLFRALCYITPFKIIDFVVIINSTVLILTLGIIFWFVVRFVDRERLFSDFINLKLSEIEIKYANVMRFYSHSVDALSLGLLISPHVWEHHYVFVIPIIILAISTIGYRKPWIIGISSFLMLVIPTFDVFPLSYHRIAGLLLLLFYTSPKIDNFIIHKDNVHNFHKFFKTDM
ncbi:MAG: glycosyltransferase family 87 protein [bacterium]